MLIAVNGTLMRGYAANPILVEAGASYVRDAATATIYRLWNIADQYPAMLRDEQFGASISLELWEICPAKIIDVLEQEPPGLVLGRIVLNDGSIVLGILAEPYILDKNMEITNFHGWREYQSARDSEAQSKTTDMGMNPSE